MMSPLELKLTPAREGNDHFRSSLLNIISSKSDQISEFYKGQDLLKSLGTKDTPERDSDFERGATDFSDDRQRQSKRGNGPRPLPFGRAQTLLEQLGSVWTLLDHSGSDRVPIKKFARKKTKHSNYKIEYGGGSH